MNDVASQFSEYVAKVQEVVGARIALNTEKRLYSRLSEVGILTETVHERLESDVAKRLRVLERRPVEALKLEPLELLRKVPLFAGLDDDSLESVARRLRNRSWTKGESLFTEGDHGDTMYLIGRGVVKVWRGPAGRGAPSLIP